MMYKTSHGTHGPGQQWIAGEKKKIISKPHFLFHFFPPLKSITQSMYFMACQCTNKYKLKIRLFPYGRAEVILQSFMFLI